jgi:hypothetical protein
LGLGSRLAAPTPRATPPCPERRRDDARRSPQDAATRRHGDAATRESRAEPRRNGYRRCTFFADEKEHDALIGWLLRPSYVCPHPQIALRRCVLAENRDAWCQMACRQRFDTPLPSESTVNTMIFRRQQGPTYTDIAGTPTRTRCQRWLRRRAALPHARRLARKGVKEDRIIGRVRMRLAIARTLSSLYVRGVIVYVTLKLGRPVSSSTWHKSG